MPHVAIIDLETTGLNPYRHDRVIELAAVVMNTNGKVEREFVTLVNPERDIGPTSVHGLTSDEIIMAPRFIEIAGAFLEAIDGCVAVAGHNIRFDQSFLEKEFSRLELAFPEAPSYCTMRMAGGGSLSACCTDYGISIGAAHSAKADAHAAAQLFQALLRDEPSKTREIENLAPTRWPTMPKTSAKPLSRDDARLRQSEPPSYLAKLLNRVHRSIPPSIDDEASIIAYTALLDRVLEDRAIDVREQDDLVNMATQWGIVGDQIACAHRDYVHRLAAAALADGVVTDMERRDVHRVAMLLGVEANLLDTLWRSAEDRLKKSQSSRAALTTPSSLGQMSGKRVCFTGECQCTHNGSKLTRDVASSLAEGKGMIVADSVTKALDFLVVSDPLTQSGKAKKARQYGVRIVHEPVFWSALGIAVQ